MITATAFLFQSTLPHGERPYCSTVNVFYCFISIHAPTRGATATKQTPYNVMVISIHAPTRGATYCGFFILLCRIEFQSTLPHGERHRQRYIRDAISNFNPRSHTGSDHTQPLGHLIHISISIHAPTRGATSKISLFIFVHFISIHAPTRGATLLLCHLFFSQLYFNPRSHTGSDSNIIQKFRIFSFICDNYKYTLHFYASFCGCIIPHNKKYAAYIWCESHRYFMCACHSHSTCYKTRG